MFCDNDDSRQVKKKNTMDKSHLLFNVLSEIKVNIRHLYMYLDDFFVAIISCYCLHSFVHSFPNTARDSHGKNLR